MKFLINKKFLLVVLIVFIISFIVFYFSKKEEYFGNENLYDLFPRSTNLFSIAMGTYYNGKQNVYCNLKLPENYFGRAMYVTSEGVNLNFEMANSDELYYSIDNGLLKQEEVIQQVYYSNKLLDANEDFAEIYANIFTNDQITYDGMKKQTLNAVEVSDVAFYNEGDKAYTDIDLTLYYYLNSDITLQISYSGPLVDQVGAKSVANQLYQLVEVVE